MRKGHVGSSLGGKTYRPKIVSKYKRYESIVEFAPSTGADNVIRSSTKTGHGAR